MIGVISKQKEHEVVEEFFQLFKTPWEFYNPDRLHYEVLIATDGNIPETDAPLMVLKARDWIDMRMWNKIRFKSAFTCDVVKI